MKEKLESLIEALDEAYYEAKSYFNNACEFVEKNPTESNFNSKSKSFDIYEKVIKARQTIRAVYNKHYNNGL